MLTEEELARYAYQTIKEGKMLKKFQIFENSSHLSRKLGPMYSLLAFYHAPHIFDMTSERHRVVGIHTGSKREREKLLKKLTAKKGT